MPNNFPFDAVLWDMDGTLIDSEPLWIEEEYRLMQSLGAEWNDEDARHCIGGPLVRVDEYMRTKLPGQFKPLELTEMLTARMIERFLQPIPFATGAAELLHELHRHDVPMALVSASPGAMVRGALASIPHGIFRAVISNDDVSRPKPDPEGYIKAASDLGIDIRRSIVLEDSITGVTAAMQAGAFVLGIAHAQELPSGPRIHHRKSLEGITPHHLTEFFALV